MINILAPNLHDQLGQSLLLTACIPNKFGKPHGSSVY